MIGPVVPHLPKTSAALAVYDASDEHWLDNGPLGRAVGVAFGEETSHLNDPEICAALVRPGLQPGPGREPSFVRRMVALWRSL